MTFKKGEVSNPLGGRSLKSRYRRFAERLLSPHTDKAVEAIVSALDSSDYSIKLAAAKLVLEYVCGKPVSSVELNGDTAIKINVNIIKN